MLPETWHYFPDDIEQSIWAKGSLTSLPKGTKGFPELFYQRPKTRTKENIYGGLAYSHSILSLSQS